MALQTEPVAHNNLVSGGQTALHSHAGGGGGADVKAGNETAIQKALLALSALQPLSAALLTW